VKISTGSLKFSSFGRTELVVSTLVWKELEGDIGRSGEYLGPENRKDVERKLN